MSQKIKHLVADTSAFIKNKALQDLAENIYTVRDVTNEIKNRRQIKRLCVLPYSLEVVEPYPEYVAHVIEFAKKTGDYLSLSAVDIKIIALTYQLEKFKVGTDHLRTEPIVAKIVISKDKPVEHVNNTPLAGFYAPKDGEESEDEIEEQTLEQGIIYEDPVEDDNESDDDDDEAENEENISTSEKELADKFASLNCNVDDVLAPVSKDEVIDENEISEDEDNEEEEERNGEGESDDDDDDDDSGWITPSNFAQVKRDFGTDQKEETITTVACISTDYAIQNVIKQMGLNIAAMDGKVIKEMRTYILRCYACFKTTSILTKLFCPNCGNKTLKRVAVSCDNEGKQVIHVNLRRPLTAKGKNASLPKPKGGKHSTNAILFEDQPIPKQMPTRVARTKTNALEDDYIAGFSPFVTRDIDSKSAILRGHTNIKQAIRNTSYVDSRRYRKNVI